MKVASLYRKMKRGAPMEGAAHLATIKGTGIQHDVGACFYSPRQALIASLPVIRELDLEETDLRANIIVDGHIESFQSGDILKMGECLIRLTFRCEPCRKLEEVQKGLIKRIGDRRGFLGMIIDGGTISPGDVVEKTSCKARPMSDEISDRFFNVINQIPMGKVLKTSDLITLLGLSSSYHRVLPSYIKKFRDRLPVHRVISTKRELLEKHIPQQSQLLKSEGIVFQDTLTIDEVSCWDFSEIFQYAYSFKERAVRFQPPTVTPVPAYKTMGLFS